MTQKLPSPKKFIARSNGPKRVHGPCNVSHRSVARSGSKYLPSHGEDGFTK